MRLLPESPGQRPSIWSRGGGREPRGPDQGARRKRRRVHQSPIRRISSTACQAPRHTLRRIEEHVRRRRRGHRPGDEIWPAARALGVGRGSTSVEAGRGRPPRVRKGNGGSGPPPPPPTHEVLCGGQKVRSLGRADRRQRLDCPSIIIRRRNARCTPRRTGGRTPSERQSPRKGLQGTSACDRGGARRALCGARRRALRGGTVAGNANSQMLTEKAGKCVGIYRAFQRNRHENKNRQLKTVHRGG